jgi:glucuronoarabinoxylan endo-1,4-beta-xylanase
MWTGIEMRNFVKNHGNQITATKLMAGDLVNNNQAFINTILNDYDAVENLDLLSTHIYGGGIIDNPLVRSKGKEIWMTEHLDTNITHAANLGTAIEIHNCFTKANFNAYIWWYGKRFYGPIGQDGLVTKRGYFISQFARFIKDGAIRLGSPGNSRGDVLVSAYRNGTKKVVVVINTGTGEIKQKININGASAGTFIPYVTSQSRNAEQGSQITATANSFIYPIPPLSVVTFAEQ